MQSALTFGPVQLSPPAADGSFHILTEIHYDDALVFDTNAPMFNLNVTPIPEPATTSLVALAVAGVSLRRRRQRAPERAAHGSSGQDARVVARRAHRGVQKGVQNGRESLVKYDVMSILQKISCPSMIAVRF